MSREAAHSARRIVRVKGDAAGRAIMTALVAAVRQAPHIRLLEGVVAQDLLTKDGAVIGLRAQTAGKRPPASGRPFNTMGLGCMRSPARPGARCGRL